MQGQPGFMGFNVISDGENYTVSSRWVRWSPCACHGHQPRTSAVAVQAKPLQEASAAAAAVCWGIAVLRFLCGQWP
jgi:hypothetical protein